MPNPRGSTGYGQKFTDDINGIGAASRYDDLMAVTDYVAKLPYVDPDRMAAAGGSYGGYMIDWMLGHTNASRRCVSHDGVYDLRSEAARDRRAVVPACGSSAACRGTTPKSTRNGRRAISSKEFQTPTLVIHGELDYRIPYRQGLQLFTALQLQKVPSKLLVFPDEGHWVLKPQNSAALVQDVPRLDR